MVFTLVFERNSRPDSFCLNVCLQFYDLNIVFLLCRNDNSTTFLTPIFPSLSSLAFGQKFRSLDQFINFCFSHFDRLFEIFELVEFDIPELLNSQTSK